MKSGPRVIPEPPVFSSTIHRTPHRSTAVCLYSVHHTSNRIAVLCAVLLPPPYRAPVVDVDGLNLERPCVRVERQVDSPLLPVRVSAVFGIESAGAASLHPHLVPVVIPVEERAEAVSVPASSALPVLAPLAIGGIC